MAGGSPLASSMQPVLWVQPDSALSCHVPTARHAVPHLPIWKVLLGPVQFSGLAGLWSPRLSASHPLSTHSLLRPGSSPDCGGWCIWPGPAPTGHLHCRKELTEAQRTNKPCGKCHYYLLISKTFVEAGKGSSRKKRGGPDREELKFANAEEEFFYEVRLRCFLRSGAGSSWASRVSRLHEAYTTPLQLGTLSPLRLPSWDPTPLSCLLGHLVPSVCVTWRFPHSTVREIGGM